MNILDIFYKNIVPEATSGRINCLMYYNMAFSTKIVDECKEYRCNIENDELLIPTLMIKNKNEFDALLTEYVDLALSFYDDSNYEEEILHYRMYDDHNRICREKVIMALLFANATIEDFNNPIDFLRRRINFIYNDFSGSYDLGYSNKFDGNLSISIDKDIINNETPYQMKIKVSSFEGDEFIFPKVSFGISDDTVYVYAIQNKINDKNSFTKRINRVLYKVGEGLSFESEDSEEKLKDITASFLVSLNMAVSFLFNKGFNKIIVPSILIERWNAKNISNLLKIKNKNLSKEEIEELALNQNYLQNNLTNKLIRTFLRLACHYNNIDVISFPYEIDSCLHMEINNNRRLCNNALLDETYKLAEINVSENRHFK